MTRKIIFVGGIHGVGKSTLCDSICLHSNAAHHSASDLISKFGKISHSTNKFVADVNKNQDVLISAVNEYLHDGMYLLDGHFCLLSKEGKVIEVPISTFESLSPVAIIVLLDDPASIYSRLKERDKGKYDIESLSSFQNKELSYSENIAQRLRIPYLRANPFTDAENITKFVQHFFKGDTF